ncbi:MAG TPA: ABC transporter ATP-binding protein [Candidatus Limnocylindrales bacterium]|nr:ABC transporter ATP-binding protein [Candidatus Limnocylindrales bacterium]
MQTHGGVAINAQALGKTYKIGDETIEVLKDMTFSINKAQFVVVTGASGSGKTTLLNIIGGIDKPTTGRIFVNDEDLTIQNEDALSDYRCNNVGFVFQSYNLVSTLTVAENIAFPMEWTGKPEEEIEKRITELLETVGLQSRANHFPAQLSGGEQQRVAFARALANDPGLILADEPTGNLDDKNGQKIVQVLQLLKEKGKTVVVATHDAQIKQLADQALYLEEGKLAGKNE